MAMGFRTTALIGLGALVAMAGAASAQSTGAPAGREPATAPGGTKGLAGPRNAAEAVRSGDAIPVNPRGPAVTGTAPVARMPAGR